MESAPPSSFRSVQLPVKSRSSNFLLALRPQRPARCWAFFNRAERSPPLSPSQSQSVTRCFAARHFAFPGSHSNERRSERSLSAPSHSRPCPPSSLSPLPPSSPLLLAGKCIFSPKQNKADLRKCYVRIMGRAPNVWDHPDRNPDTWDRTICATICVLAKL